MAHSFTDKDIYAVYFRELTRDDLHPKWKEDKLQVICKCNKVLAKQANGFTNAANHVKSQHKGEFVEKVEEYLNLKVEGQKSVLDFFSIPAPANNMYKWIDWVVMENHPFNFVEKKRTRKNSNLTPVNVTTFMKYLRLVTTRVEMIIKSKLPPKFGLILDGWSGNGIHFSVLFACTVNESCWHFHPFLTLPHNLH